MNTATDMHLWFERLVEQDDPAFIGDMQPWMKQMRNTARSRLTSLPIPTRKTEAWKYTWLDGLFAQSFAPANNEIEALQQEDIEEWLLEDTDAYRIVFTNSHMVPALTSFDELPEGIIIGSLRQALHQQPDLLSIWLNQAAHRTDDVFSALNTALINDGLFVHLDQETVLDRPLEVLHLNLSIEQPALIQPSSLLVLERGARATIIERFCSTGETTYFHNGVSEILLEDNASLKHIRLQEESRQAYHLHRSFLSQGAQSHYHCTSLSLGAQWSRHELQARFQAQGATCDTSGLYLVGDKQLADQHLDVLHNTPANTSRHNFKGIIYGSGRAVFDGRIFVNKNAQKTDAELSNKNLLLSRQAEVDTKPQLEIYADDVKCSHGTTIGQLDPEQLYYLRSRGIDQLDAIKLLCTGFAGEILDNIDMAPVRDHIERQLHEILDQVVDTLSEQPDE